MTKLTDFDAMLNTSTDIANERYNESSDELTVVITDEDGNQYLIEDVTYNPYDKCIQIHFAYDSEEVTD